MIDKNWYLQVDEPALREGLPLKQERWQSYLEWAVKSFRLATAVAKSPTQIVTHLCYSEFADILEVCLLRSNPAFLSPLPNYYMRGSCQDTAAWRGVSSWGQAVESVLLQAIDGLEADVLTIENSRSGNEMINALAKFGYSRVSSVRLSWRHSPSKYLRRGVHQKSPFSPPPPPSMFLFGRRAVPLGRTPSQDPLLNLSE